MMWTVDLKSDTEGGKLEVDNKTRSRGRLAGIVKAQFLKGLFDLLLEQRAAELNPFRHQGTFSILSTSKRPNRGRKSIRPIEDPASTRIWLKVSSVMLGSLMVMKNSRPH